MIENSNIRFSDLVIHNDHHILIANKPAGMPVQPDKSQLAESYAKSKLHLHNRLDRPVSGLVLFTKKKTSTQGIEKQHDEGKLIKKYWAVVNKSDHVKKATLNHFYLKMTAQHKAICSTQTFKDASEVKLDYETLHEFDRYNLLEVSIERGKFHQIRAQLAAEKMFIKGDVKYGSRRKNVDRSIHLHAHYLSFNHPSNKKQLEFRADPVIQDGLWKAVLEALNAI